MAEFNQVASCFIASKEVVSRRSITAESRWDAIKADNGKATTHEPVKGDSWIGASDEYSIDSVAEERIELLLFLIGIFIRVAEDDRVSGRTSNFLCPDNDFRVKRICHVRKDHPHDLRSTGLETSSNLIRLIVQGLHGFANPFGALGTDDSGPVRNCRDCCDRNFRQTSHISHGRRTFFIHAQLTKRLGKDCQRVLSITFVHRYLGQYLYS
jgi:hypothetical protein